MLPVDSPCEHMPSVGVGVLETEGAGDGLPDVTHHRLADVRCRPRGPDVPRRLLREPQPEVLVLVLGELGAGGEAAAIVVYRRYSDRAADESPISVRGGALGLLGPLKVDEVCVCTVIVLAADHVPLFQGDDLSPPSRRSCFRSPSRPSRRPSPLCVQGKKVSSVCV
jgi:hypothetical protein